MNIRRQYLFFILIILLISAQAKSQDTTSMYDKFYNLPDRVFNGMNRKTEQLEEKMIHQTEKYLAKLERQEKKLKKKLQKTDSIAAMQMFGDIERKYASIREKVHSKSSAVVNLNNRYSPYLDSLKTGLTFLNKIDDLNKGSELQQKVNTALKSYQSLNSTVNGIEEVRKYVKQREIELRGQLEKFGMKKELDAFKKQVYYYRAQMEEYRQILNDPSKAEQKLLQVANRFPKFREFFGKYSDLARLFPTPDDFGTPASLAGLQTRTGVQQYIQDRLGAAGPNALPMVQANIQDAQQQLGTLKNKINELGKGTSDADMPDFKPNSQKTKSFLQRIELGTNLQTVKTNGFYPATTDLGLSVGYKINDRSVVGIGGSYKFGMGTINHIVFTHEGVGLRSFLDWKVKGSFYIAGGFEYNYQQPFNEFQQVYDFDNWQKSGLVGLSKVVSLNNKFFKKTKIQLLWDLLSYQQIPKTQPFKFRFGYDFK